ncbi:MAG: hypothetical protein KH321_00095 [Clostridium sp.]|nr:hypothetical protein [Clostridium sp.]
MNGYSSIPANYQNGLYWQYFMKSFEDAMAMYNAKANANQNSIMTSGASSPANNSYNAVSQSAVNDTQSDAYKAAQAQTAQTQAASAPVLKEVKDGKVYVVADGKDDGKISGAQKFANFAKGVGNFFKGMVCDETGKFSIKRTLTTVAVAAGAAALTVATGGAAAPFLVAAGAAMGAVEVGKGAYKAATAKTDAEAEAAWQSIGSGTVGIGLSVAGAKGSLKAAKVDVSGYKGVTGAVKATGKTFKYSADGIKNGYQHVKSNGVMSSMGDAKTALADGFKTNWEAKFKSTSTKENLKSNFENKYDVKIAKNDAKIEKLMNEIVKLQENGSKNAGKIAKKQNEMKALLNENTRLAKMKNSIPENPVTVNNKARIKEINKQVEELRAEIKEIKETLPEADVSSIEKEIAVKLQLKNKLAAEQTPLGARELQLKKLEARQKVYEEAVKNSEGGTKKAYKKHLEEVKMRKAEVERLLKVEQAQHSAEAAKARLPKYEAKLKQINEAIETVKNNTSLTQEEKVAALTNLAKEQGNATRLVNAAKARINSGKRTLHLENAKLFEAANRKAVGYPTIAMTGGNVTNELTTYDPQDIQAMMYGFSSAAEMEAALKAEGSQSAQEAQMAAQESAAANTQAQAQTAAKTTAQTTTSVTNPYTQYSLYSQMNMTPPMGTGLEFQDVYKSPYAGLI